MLKLVQPLLSLCRQWNLAALPLNQPNRLLYRRCAKLSATASLMNIRAALVKSLTARLSVLNMAISLSISVVAKVLCAAMNPFRANSSNTGIVSAPIFMMPAARHAARRFSCRAPIRNSWRLCSPWKCLKFTTVLSKLNRWPAIPAPVRKLRLSAMIPRLIRLALALVCAAPACRLLLANCRAKRSILSRGRLTLPHLL